MSDFSFYLLEGFKHISDIHAYDHLLFIVVLCLPYLDNKHATLFWMITAFTFGHSISLALSVLQIVNIPSVWIEILIPVTIAFTALQNILSSSVNSKLRYSGMLFFGIIHGLGFSNFLKSMLGSSQSIFKELLAFNIGLEIGQILIVFVVFLIYVFINHFTSIRSTSFKTTISWIVFVIAIWMTIQRMQELT